MTALAGLLAEVADAKRIRSAGAEGTLAARRFASAWAALCAGEDVRDVALGETAAALCAVRLGDIDADVLRAAGLSDDEARQVMERAFDDVAPPGSDEIRAFVGATGGSGRAPAFVARLAAQPRAGATSPGRPRIMLEPPESHAEHCWVTAVGAVLLSAEHGADVATPFLCGLAHHLHNAVLPDAGFAGETMLGEHLDGVLRTLTEQGLAELPAALAAQTREALGLLAGAESPEARAFHAADVLDRVLQMRHHARAAGFTLDQALDELDLVHEGPLQAFGLAVVEEAGLR